MGVEPTTRLAKSRINGFEGHEDHRTPFASDLVRASDYAAYSTYATPHHAVSAAVIAPLCLEVATHSTRLTVLLKCSSANP